MNIASPVDSDQHPERAVELGNRQDGSMILKNFARTLREHLHR